MDSFNKTNIEQMQWLFERISSLHAVPLDPLRLASALHVKSPKDSKLNLLESICHSLDWEKPKKILHPDSALKIIIVLDSKLGWGLVRSQQPSGEWLVQTENGSFLIKSEDTQNYPFFYLQPPRSSLKSLQGDFKTTLRNGLRQYRSVVFEAALASIFIGALTLGVSLYSMQVYDRVIPVRTTDTLVILGLGVFIMIILELAMKFARARIMDEVVTGLDAQLSRDIFQRLLNIRVDQLPGTVGSLAAQIRGYEQIRSFYTASTLFTLVDLPLSLIFIAIIAMLAAPMVALVPLLLGLIALLLGLLQRRYIQRLAKEGAQTTNLKTGLLVECVEGAETIKAGGGGWKFLSRWLDVNAFSIRNDLAMRNATEGVSYISATFQQISYVGLVSLGAWYVMQGDMTIGALIASSILSGRIMAPILILPSLLVQQAHAKAAEDGLEALYTLRVDNHGIERPLVPTHIRGEYGMRDVRFSYNESAVAFAVKQLHIRAGEHVGIVGPIGSGKTTLLRLLAGIYQPQEGRVLLDGLDITHINHHVLTQQIGYLQQDHRLFLGTLRENLLIGLSDPGDEVIRQAIVRTGLNELVASHPKGLELPIVEGGKGLSGGQKQLVAFTRLLLSNTPILLLDEPTAGMDKASEQRCLAVLAEEVARDHKTLIVVTHKTELLPLLDRLIVVSNHTIVLDGPSDDVLKKIEGKTAPTNPKNDSTN